MKPAKRTVEEINRDLDPLFAIAKMERETLRDSTATYNKIRRLLAERTEAEAQDTHP